MATHGKDNTADEMNDLGRARFDQATAAMGDRDDALYADGPVFVRQGRAPAGMEQQVFAWSTFQYETDERDDREERKGDLHGGQLHRQNRAARGEPTGPPPPRASSGRGRGGRGRGGHNGLNGQNGQGAQDELQPKICARAQEGVPNLAKGKPQELSDDLFWDKPIC